MATKPKLLHGFTPADLRAFGEGRKTQYRVPVKFNDSKYCAPLPHVEYARDGMPIWFSSEPTDQIRQSDYFDNGYPCPLGKPGDRLFITETWGYYRPFARDPTDKVIYRADRDHCGQYPLELDGRVCRVTDRDIWRSPRTMAAKHARYWCEIVAVRVERSAEVWEWVIELKKVEGAK